jgi:hydroxyisourate hydrolase
VSGGLPLANGRRRLLRIGLFGAAMAGVSRAPGVAAEPGGSLEVHALDATIGKPAEGVVVDLFLVSTEPALEVARKATNAGGQATLVAGASLKVGRYELRLAIGDYFRRRGLVPGTSPFFEVVPIRLHLGDPNRHYHVPVVFTPWSYTMHG